MKNKYKDDVDENGYPLDKGYLEVGLPSMLQESIDKMKITNQLIKEGKQCLDWDCDWCELMNIPWWRSHPIHENRATKSIWTEPCNPLLRATKSTKRATSA